MCSRGCAPAPPLYGHKKAAFVVGFLSRVGPVLESFKQQGVFFDDYDDAFMNETRCLQRALDFRVFCHAQDSPEAVSALYAPTAKLFVVSQLDPRVDDANNALVAPPPEATAAEPVGAENNDGQAVTFVFNSTVRAMWPVARVPPAFASRAVPLALFDLAGEYLDCRAPPLPLAATAPPAAAATAQSHARASRYHCNGPHAQLAVEALQLYLAVVPTHADAHYNLGVAFYTLTELDHAVGCFVAALRCECVHVHAYIFVRGAQLKGRPAETLFVHGENAHARPHTVAPRGRV